MYGQGDFTSWISLLLSLNPNLTAKFWTESEVQISLAKTKWQQKPNKKLVKVYVKSGIDICN